MPGSKKQNAKSAKKDKKVNKEVDSEKSAASAKSSQKGGKKKVASKKPSKKAAPKKVVPQKGGDVDDDAPKSRYFKLIVGDDEPRGRFSGKKPKQAASKALTALLNERRSNGDTTEGNFSFTMVECTRGCNRKSYNYTGYRKKLDEPLTVKIGDREVTYSYENHVAKDKKE